MKIIDISRGLFSTPVYPGDPEPRIESVYQLSEGKVCNLSALFACLHTGTHVDAPLHFIERGTPVEEMDLSRFIGKCRVVAGDGLIDREKIDGLEMSETPILLFKGSVSVTASAAEALTIRGIRTIGTEMNTIGNFDAHRALLGKSIGIIENLDLTRAECGEYFLFAPPIKIEGADGAFCRAVLMTD